MAVLEGEAFVKDAANSATLAQGSVALPEAEAVEGMEEVTVTTTGVVGVG